MRHSVKMLLLFGFFALSGLTLFGFYKVGGLVVRSVRAEPTVICEKLPQQAGVDEVQVHVTRGTMSLHTHFLHGERKAERFVDIGSGCIREVFLDDGSNWIADYGCRLKGAPREIETKSLHGFSAVPPPLQEDWKQLRKDALVCYAGEP